MIDLDMFDISNQVHIDLETLDTAHTAKILSIGAVCAEETFYCEIDQALYPQGDVFTASQDTIEWWESQGGFKPSCESVSPAAAMACLSDWWGMVAAHNLDGCEVWANSPSFDCKIINHHLTTLAASPLWNFWQERDVRTVKAVAKAMKLPIRTFNNPHNALKDALNQQAYVKSVYSTLANQLHKNRPME